VGAILLDIIKSIDISLFRFINCDMHNKLLDFIMPIITTSEYWRVPMLIGYIVLAILGHKKGRETFILTLLAVILSDWMTGHVLKPAFHRLRPFEILQGVNLLAKAYADSFPSAHASNMFTMAFVMSYIWRKPCVVGISFAAAVIVGFSRIYVGVHFPGDVFAGAITAVFYSIAAIYLFKTIRLVRQSIFSKKNNVA